MLSLSATATAILADIKKSRWLFDVTTAAGIRYSWATAATTTTEAVVWETDVVWEADVVWETQDVTYTSSILNFSGVTMNRSNTESGQMSFNTMSFSVPNKANTIDAADFVGATITAGWWINDGSDSEVATEWQFVVSAGGVTDNQQVLSFKCESLLSKYVKGVYPNGQLVSAIAPEYSMLDDLACVPEIFGSPYANMFCLLDTNTTTRHYLLGLASHTYAITKVHSPEEADGSDEYDSGSYTFTQKNYTFGGVSYRVVAPVIMDADADGTADSTGLWASGQSFLSAPMKLTRNDTATMISPVDQIKFILEDMGVPTWYIDGSGTFTATKATVDGWGLEWNLNLSRKENRKNLLSRLLNSCNCYILETDKIEIHPYIKTSQKTFDNALIKKTGNEPTDPSSFKTSNSYTSESDSGYVRYYDNTKPDYMSIVAIAAPNTTTATIESGELFVPSNDSQVAIRIGELHYIRRIYKDGSRSFKSQISAAIMQPNDVITISGDNYGGIYDVVVSKVTIYNNMDLAFDCDKYSISLEDFADSTPGAVTPATDITTDYWRMMRNHYTVRADGGEEFRTIQAALAAVPSGGGMIFVYNGDYTLENGGTTIPNANIDIYGESRNGVQIGNYASSEGFILSGAYSDKQYRFNNFSVTSNNGAATSTSMFLFSGGTGSRDCRFLFSKINIGLSDSDFGIYAGGGSSAPTVGTVSIDDIYSSGGDRFLYFYTAIGNPDTDLKAINCNILNCNYAFYNNNVDLVSINDNTMSGILKTPVNIQSSNGTSSVSRNKIAIETSANDASGDLIYGILSNAGSIDINDNHILFNDNRTTGVCMGVYHNDHDSTISGNEININTAKDYDTIGIELGSTASALATATSILGNNIRIDNKAISTNSNVGIRLLGTGSGNVVKNTINSNIINGVNNGAKDYGITLYLADYNYGRGNLAIDGGTAYVDTGGTGNSITIAAV